MKIGSIEWTNERLWKHWQAVRNVDEYKAFCDKYSQYFNSDGMLEAWRLPTEEAEREVEEFQGRYGLDIIYHYKIDHDIDYFIDDCVFENPFAIDFLLKNEESEDFNPFWDNNNIVLKVNLDGRIPDAQLMDEFLELIQAARKSIGIKPVRAKPPDKVDFQVYDLSQRNKSPKEIISEVWPDEYKTEFEGMAEHERDELYEKLSLECQEQGLRDWNARVFAEAYPEDACKADYTSKSGRIRLYVRVSDTIKKVEKYINRIKK